MESLLRRQTDIRKSERVVHIGAGMIDLGILRFPKNLLKTVCNPR